MSGELGDRIRLTVSPQEREARPYMTLSYHWVVTLIKVSFLYFGEAH